MLPTCRFSLARRLVLVALAAALGSTATSEQSRADSIVNFWLSNVDAGPAAGVHYVAPDAQTELLIWARPQAGYRLSAFSLDLTSTQPGVAEFTSVTVLNPDLDVTPDRRRHQLVFDSTSGLFVEPTLIDSFLGYSFFDDAGELPDGGGIGPLCGIDPDCSTASGAASWRIATVSLETGDAYGSTELYLQIGEHGLWQSPGGAQQPDPPTSTSAVFGLANDTINQWTVPSIGGVDHRHDHQGAADAVITVASADFNQDGDVDGRDYLIWQRGFDWGTTLSEGDADADDDVDEIDLAAWRYQFGAATAATSVGSAIPEPSSAFAAVGLATIGVACVRRARVAA